jgi:transposase
LDISEFKHYRINHSKLFADQHNHINGIENFWSQAKRVLRKYNGIPVKYFTCSSRSVNCGLITAP